jgi:hypothetical protein
MTSNLQTEGALDADVLEVLTPRVGVASISRPSVRIGPLVKPPAIAGGRFAGATQLLSSRAFSGEVKLEASVANLPADPGIDPDRPIPAGSFNAKMQIAEGWNLIRNNLRALFEDLIEDVPRRDLPGGVRRLYNAKARIGWATPETDFAVFTVQEAARIFSISYFVPASRVTFKADVRFWDPKITVKFDLAVELRFTTAGDPKVDTAVQLAGPVYLTDLQIRIIDPRATVQGSATTRIIDFFKTGSFARQVELEFGGTTSDLLPANVSRLFTKNMVDALEKAASEGHSILTVRPVAGEADNLILRLIQPRPVVG